jgi:hypothetical protein
LIPLGMVADELPHPLKERFRHLGLQAHSGAPGARWEGSRQRQIGTRRTQPFICPVRWTRCGFDHPSDLSFRFGIAHGAPRQCSQYAIAPPLSSKLCSVRVLLGLGSRDSLSEQVFTCWRAGGFLPPGSRRRVVKGSSATG